MQLKSLHETPVRIPMPGGEIKFNPGQIREVPDELGKKTLGSKGWEEVKEVKPKKETKKKSKKLIDEKEDDK